jgi:hypothetical protein
MKRAFISAIGGAVLLVGCAVPDGIHRPDSGAKAAPVDLLHERAKSVEQLSKQLPTVIGKPPEYWTAIANNRSLPCFQRRMCLFELVSRHLYMRENMRISDFVKVLRPAKWLSKGEIEYPMDKPLTGNDVVSWDAPAVVFWIYPRLPERNNSCISIRIDPQGVKNEKPPYARTISALRALLMGKDSSNSASGIKIQELGFVEEFSPEEPMRAVFFYGRSFNYRMEFAVP